MGGTESTIVNSSRNQNDDEFENPLLMAQGASGVVVSHEQGKNKYLPQVHSSMQRHNSQARGLESIASQRRAMMVNAEVYSSQQSLVMPAPTGSLASA